MNLNETQTRRLEIERQYWEFARQMGDAKHGCQHTNLGKGRLIWSPAKQRIVQTHEEARCKDDDCCSIYCQDCDTEMGWFCPVNPKGYCEYDWEKTGENCIFCHIPEERK
jgi:hypothetical protein